MIALCTRADVNCTRSFSVALKILFFIINWEEDLRRRDNETLKWQKSSIRRFGDRPSRDLSLCTLSAYSVERARETLELNDHWECRVSGEFESINCINGMAGNSISQFFVHFFLLFSSHPCRVFPFLQCWSSPCMAAATHIKLVYNNGLNGGELNDCRLIIVMVYWIAIAIWRWLTNFYRKIHFFGGLACRKRQSICVWLDLLSHCASPEIKNYCVRFHLCCRKSISWMFFFSS